MVNSNEELPRALRWITNGAQIRWILFISLTLTG